MSHLQATLQPFITIKMSERKYRAQYLTIRVRIASHFDFLQSILQIVQSDYGFGWCTIGIREKVPPELIDRAIHDIEEFAERIGKCLLPKEIYQKSSPP